MGIVSEPPRFTHYGEIYKRVDMRAEVGRMTRNIHITSEVAEGQTNGGIHKVILSFISWKYFKCFRITVTELRLVLLDRSSQIYKPSGWNSKYDKVSKSTLSWLCRQWSFQQFSILRTLTKRNNSRKDKKWFLFIFTTT